VGEGIEHKGRPGSGHRDLTPAEGMAQAAAKLWHSDAARGWGTDTTYARARIFL
jgi:hypothetical protein